MRISDLSPHIANSLAEQMKRLTSSFKNFPFFIHTKSHSNDRNKFTLFWTTKEEHFGTPERSEVVSELYCEVVGLHDARILLDVKPRRRRRYLGQEQLPLRSFDERDWYKQEWREDGFLVEASASALWTIMEAHADFEHVVEKVMAE